MRKILVLLLLSTLSFSQVLMKMNINSSGEKAQIIMPDAIFLKGYTMRFKGEKVDLGILKEKGKIFIATDGEKMEISLEPYKLRGIDPEGKYTKFKLRVEGEDSISITLPLWLLRAVFSVVKPLIQVSHEKVVMEYRNTRVKYREEDPLAEKAAKLVLDFITSPHKFIGGYAGPIKFLHIEEENETVDITLE